MPFFLISSHLQKETMTSEIVKVWQLSWLWKNIATGWRVQHFNSLCDQTKKPFQHPDLQTSDSQQVRWPFNLTLTHLSGSKNINISYHQPDVLSQTGFCLQLQHYASYYPVLLSLVLEDVLSCCSWVINQVSIPSQ